MRDDNVSIIGNIKHRIKRAVLGPRASGEEMIAFLRGKGMVIGENTVIHDITDVFIDPSRPWMITIGDNVQITRGVTILTHGYDWSVLKGLYGDVLGSAGHVRIGSNVFIGMNATILKGVNVGDNVIIGANSLINKDVPNNCVVAGNPQRIICSIEEYLEKRRRAQLSEAADLYRYWRRNSPEGKRGEVPSKRIFHEFFWLFENNLPGGGFQEPLYEDVMHLCGTYNKSVQRFKETKKVFPNYESFIHYLDSTNDGW